MKQFISKHSQPSAAWDINSIHREVQAEYDLNSLQNQVNWQLLLDLFLINIFFVTYNIRPFLTLKM